MTLIIVDHKKDRAQNIRELLKGTSFGVEIEFFKSASEAFSWVQTNDCCLILVDQDITEDEAQFHLFKGLKLEFPILVLRNHPEEMKIDFGDRVHDFIGPIIERTTLLQRVENLMTLQESQNKLRAMQDSMWDQNIKRFELAVSGSNDGVWDWDLIEDKIFLSARWCEIVGYREEDLGSAPGAWFSRIHPEDASLVDTAIQTHLAGATERLSIEYRIRHKNGYYRWVLTRGQAIFDADGQVSRLVGSQTDVTDRKKDENMMIYNALHDPLTGIANRSLLMERLQQVIIHRKRDPNYTYSVMFLDLDKFKEINDNLGHEAGDVVLKTVVKRLNNCVRLNDTVSRFGGDEFVILAIGINSENDAECLAMRILKEMEKPIRVHDMEIVVGISIGIVADTLAYEDAESSVRDADLALYQAKAKGRNRYEIFNHTMDMVSGKHFSMQTNLSGARARGELLLHYQPVISLLSKEIIGFEALMRWQHPENGIVYPLDFIPLAEETGLINDIGAWGLGEACKQFREWQDKIPGADEWFMSVNVSGRQLETDRFLAIVEEVMLETGMAASNLIIEITENVLMHDVYQVLPRLHQLKELGVRLAIDDFGTGYSSLAVLNDFPFDILKIAREFVAGIDGRHKSARTVKLINMLADEMGMQSIVEGVETNGELDAVKGLGCTIAQGYLFSRPKDAESITAYLEADPKKAFSGDDKLETKTA